MRLRTVGFAAFAAAAIMQSCQPACAPVPPPPVPGVQPPPPPPPPTRIVIDGQGNGHGRGLSAWGAYGMAVNGGAPWWSILDHYYGGTTNAPAADDQVRVRLMASDAAGVVGVVSTSLAAVWNGGSYGAVHVYPLGADQYDVYGSSDVTCPGGGGSWVYLGRVAGPVVVTTPFDETATAPGDVLGVCQPNGSVVHYRGALTVTADATGATRLVNRLRVENYLRGVLSREVSTSWGDAGRGAGMNASVRDGRRRPLVRPLPGPLPVRGHV